MLAHAQFSGHLLSERLTRRLGRVAKVLPLLWVLQKKEFQLVTCSQRGMSSTACPQLCV